MSFTSQIISDHIKSCIQKNISKHINSNFCKTKVSTIEFKIEGYDKALVEATAQFFASSAHHMGAKTNGMNGKPMNIAKWSVLSSPHVHKTAWTQFERRTHLHEVKVNFIPSTLVRPLLWYLQQHLPPDLRFECSITENVKLSEATAATQSHQAI